MPDAVSTATKFLQDLWDGKEAAAHADDPLRLLRYRSNVLGADLRITNFGGGNTSSKFDRPDPVTGEPVRVMAVKGSGGDLRSIGESGFAVLDLERLRRLASRYRGEAHEDDMVALYPLCAFGENRVAASIDTPLHAFLPFDHVDHLHPDWAIAIAASANGRDKLDEFNRTYGRRLVWLPWQRPGFELAMMLKNVVAQNPGCEGVVLGSHGLFTWGDTQRDCYWNSIKTIDQMGEFIERHARQRGRFGGARVTHGADRDATAADILPRLRGALSGERRVVGHLDGSGEAIEFANSAWAADLCALGTSCPDHFLRTRISPMFVRWDPAVETTADLAQRIEETLETYRRDYAAYYSAHAQPDSPRMRGSNPSVVVIPALGVFGFGSDKREARITTEFFANAVHVMAGANAFESESSPSGPGSGTIPQARHANQEREFRSFHNYVALPRSEAFRIEYWALEEAKLRRMPAEREFSRRIAVVVGGASGIGREVALELARRGGHVAVADQNVAAAEAAAAEAQAMSSSDMVMAARIDLTDRSSIASAIRSVVLGFGGVDIVVNTAAIYPTLGPGAAASDSWARTMEINVTGNFVLADEARRVMELQKCPAAIVFTSSANALVPKAGSEPYDVSKAAINHLIRELAVGMGPLIRVNGIAPATVVAGSGMFPRDRVLVSLRKYEIAHRDDETTESLRDKLAAFYAQRTITRRPITPTDCAQAICWLASDQSAKTTGHVIPVDGGLPEAFLR